MKNIALAFPLIVLIEVIAFVSFYTWQNQAIYEFEQRQLDLQVNYSTDAAVQEMLANGTNLGTDYASWGEMTLEPQLAYDTYISVLIRNMGWADTKENREDLVELYVPFFCVAVYDGYYMYMRQHEELDTTSKGQIIGYEDGNAVVVDHYDKSVTNTVYEMRWTPKIPYSDTVVSSDSNIVYYFYNLGDQVYGTYDTRANKIKYDNVLAQSGAGPGSLAKSRTIVNDTLTDACNSALFTGLEGKVDSKWYIPSSFSEWSNSNPVMTPSVLTYVSNEGGMSKFESVTFGVGGAKVDDAQFCICYTYTYDDGTTAKLYTWARNRELVESKYKDKGVKIVKIVTEPKQAALSGYWFDLNVR